MNEFNKTESKPQQFDTYSFFHYLGPGAYNTKDTITKRGGLMVTKDKRFKELKEDGPGPAAYEVCFSTPIIKNNS